MVLWPEQKTEEFKMDLVPKFCKAVDLGLDTCTATSAAVKACFPLPEHRMFVGCRNDSACFKDALPSLVEI